MVRILLSIVILLVGLLIYISSAFIPQSLELLKVIVGAIGLFCATTVAVQLLQDYILKRFDNQAIARQIASAIHKESFEKLGVFKIYPRRSISPTFGDVLKSTEAGEIWAFGTSLSFIVPYYLHDVAGALDDGRIEFFFMLLDPNSDATTEYSKSVREEPTLRMQIAHNVEQLKKLKIHYPDDLGPLQIRLSSIVPHGSILYIKNQARQKRIIYYTPYRYNTTGIDAFTMEVGQPMHSPEAGEAQHSIFADIEATIEKMWESGEALDLQKRYYPQ